MKKHKLFCICRVHKDTSEDKIEPVMELQDLDEML